ncbi:MAG: SDR family NAD(P)-dependent oxidoreductase [Candidatus Nanopelagicales bacterium]
MTDLRTRSIIVVGATGGLGAPIAALLAEAGAQLTLVARDESRLAAVDVPGQRVAIDVRLASSPDRIVDAATSAYGGLDGIVYAAGAVAFGSVDELPDEVMIDLFTLNTLAPIRLLRAGLPALRASAAAGHDPVAVHISAVVAEQPQAGMAAYSASKAALAAYDSAAMRELRREGIRLIDVRPPHTETGLAQGLAAMAVAERIVTAIREGEKDLPSASFTG